MNKVNKRINGMFANIGPQTAIKQQPATYQIIGPISVSQARKKVKNGNKRKLWKFPVPQKSLRKSRKLSTFPRRRRCGR
jgi:hypothetical protein